MNEIKKYSQGNEETAILAACGATGGTFWDIGAWAARDFSNTRALYELGWSGLMIEPSPGPLRNLVKDYAWDPRVRVIGAAVGLEKSLIEMKVTDDAVSTSDTANFDKWKGHAEFYGSVYIPVITIPEIINQFGGAQMVSIDAEGISVDLFKAMLATGMRPRCVCLEYDDRLAECLVAANACGYSETFCDGNNVIFVK